MVKIFLSVSQIYYSAATLTGVHRTGGTGYIGGDVLSAIVEAHPDYEITCLARNAEKAGLLNSRYPFLSTIVGDLDDSHLLAEQAVKADIVCHLANCEHPGAVQAISKGFSQLDASSPAKAFIHLSGSDILCFEDLDNSTYGTKSNKFYDDMQGVDEVLDIPKDAPHQSVDSVVTQLGSKNKVVKTAIVCPPAIYGTGRGPGNKRSIQVPELVSHTLKRGQGFRVGQGENRWATVNIQDLAQLFLKLVEDAASGTWKGTWGRYGFYFAGSGLASWGDVSAQIAQEAVTQGFLKSGKVDSLSWEEADKVWEYSSIFLGTNSLCKSLRAKEVLGWVPEGRSLGEEIRDLINQEATSLGLARIH
ncbi:Uncharacterized protein HZ326_4282 [Fusarium oxysporum f. sp. albedinis]|nr:hypothetical protein FOMA001_g5708 [Fusarium oxysporum f. sp. matthiolae]KAJ0153277.1 Uncharacterized protein HZ326_4282 [Fusarium oxysporum f. sp. albedinis]